ncbi:PucR family transcriptional regulator [Hoyosella sp. G463]|uniref:PucR family transcriptional regulator n=1 Tax=Lolliginicoccus lacisalsi TaxID=2742202 RepID=A0A927PKD1_9ACTN|nr:helix-turn-helix domain-containing protein [Lolliginicoccus lacisalsi]MBD8505578.1 PucR family transcriptional regulator [Lolliginicoccus lacisalsi]
MTSTARPPRVPSADNPLSDALLRRLKQYSGRLSTEAVKSMQEQLDFFADLDAEQRSTVHLLVQNAVSNFVDWMKDPDRDIWKTVDSFRVVPNDLARGVTLRQTVEMVRVAMEFFENYLSRITRNDQQLQALTVAVLRYRVEVGFAAAAVYATAAESRGAWDTRLEALVVDAVVRGDSDSSMLSRAATLNWEANAPATVIVGTPPPDSGVSAVSTVHAAAEKHRRSALSVVQGSTLVAIINGEVPVRGEFISDLLEAFSDSHVVIGPTAPSLSTAHTSWREANIALRAAPGWRMAPRPALASDLLPERALLGDAHAVRALNTQIVTPLAKAANSLSETLDVYLDAGGAVEACARALFVHPNTVRYRLKKIAEITGLEPNNPRDAYVLRVAESVGRLMRSDAEPLLQFPDITSVTL